MRYMHYGNELYHHGVKGQKWGIRRYQNYDGTYTAAGKKRYSWSDASTSEKAKRYFTYDTDFRRNKEEDKLRDKRDSLIEKAEKTTGYDKVTRQELNDHLWNGKTDKRVANFHKLKNQIEEEYAAKIWESQDKGKKEHTELGKAAFFWN